MSETDGTASTTLYCIYGERSELLYVGISDDPERRMRQHSEKAWWRDVRHIEHDTFPTRAQAKAAETTAIQAESPKHNVAETGRGARVPRIPRAEAPGGKRLVSIADAASYLAVSTKTIRRRIADGTLTGHRIAKSRTIRIDLRDVECMLRPIPGAER